MQVDAGLQEKTSRPRRPILRYHGGKWRLAGWIASHFPPHRIYVEPFGGAGSVLLKKERSYAEVYNDLDSEIVNLFEIARTKGDELIRLLRLTPYSRVEFERAAEPTSDALESARRLVIRSYMGFGPDSLLRKNVKTGFRSDVKRPGTIPSHDWSNYPDALAMIVERLRGVTIENVDYRRIIEKYDCDDALFYIDPPYPKSTRARPDHGYKFEMNESQHRALARILTNCAGMVILSGYPCPLYDELFRGWHKVTRLAYTGTTYKTEAIWLNPRAQEALTCA